MARDKDASRGSEMTQAHEEPAGGDAQPLYTLSVAAQLVGLAPRTIRAYEEAGLIAPARCGRNNQRLYSRQDLRWLKCIYEMVHFDGYTLRAIRRLLDFAPCWEIRQCPETVARRCAKALRIPPPEDGRPGWLSVEKGERGECADEPVAEAPVHIKLIWGLQEFGTIMHCSRCINAERTIRKVAEEFRPHVVVSKHDILSEEARRYGVLMTPSIIINDEVVSIGKGLSEQKLRELIQRHLAAARKENRTPRSKGRRRAAEK